MLKHHSPAMPVRRENRLHLLLLLLSAAVAGCGGDPPSAAYDVATQGVFAGALSAQSELTLVGSLNHGGSLWQTQEHARLFNWNHRPDEFSELVAAAFSADGTRAVTTDPRTLVVWDTRTGASLAYWTTPATTLDVAISADGQVLMGLTDHSAVLFDAASGSHLQTFLHQDVVSSVDLSSDGQKALTGSDDNSAVLWNAASGAAVHRFRHDDPVRVTALSTTGRYAFTASQGRKVTVWDGRSGEPVLTVAKQQGRVSSARFSGDERYLLIGYVNHHVELWDLAAGRRLERWDAGARNPWHPTGAAVVAVGFSALPRRFYALAGDGRLLALDRG